MLFFYLFEICSRFLIILDQVILMVMENMIFAFGVHQRVCGLFYCQAIQRILLCLNGVYKGISQSPGLISMVMEKQIFLYGVHQLVHGIFYHHQIQFILFLARLSFDNHYYPYQYHQHQFLLLLLLNPQHRHKMPIIFS